MYFIKAYRYLNILSIDVALGSLCCALFFAKLLRVHILPYGLISLGLTVWIIYTADHLLDASRIVTRASTKRHLFHQKYFNSIRKALVLAISLNSLLLFFIRERVLIGGIVLVIGIGMYLLAQRYFKFLKEFLIAVFYTIGILLPSIMITDFLPQNIPWVVIIQFAIAALINLLLFSWFDYSRDKRDSTTSFATIVGTTTTCRCIVILFTVNVALNTISTFLIASNLIIAMSLILLLLLMGSNYFCKEERFRLIGDAVFFLPILYLWL